MLSNQSSKFARMKFRTQSSLDFGMYINWPLPYTFSQPDITSTHLVGRSGDILVDNHSRQNVTLTVNFFVRKPDRYSSWFALKNDIADWIMDNDYNFLSFDTQENYVWSAIAITPPTLTETNDLTGTGTITFNCKPFLYRNDGIDFQPLPPTGVVYNTENMQAIPDWHIVGDGEFTLTVNDLEYVMEVDGEMFIDGENCQAYKSPVEDRNGQVQFANNDTPVLEMDKNIITFSGNLNAIEYRPNWRRLA